MLTWSPALRSADAELLPDMDSMVGRSHDLQRNHAMIRAGVRTHNNNVVGAQLKLSWKPMWRLLGVDEKWVKEHGGAFIKDVENRFWAWANDPDYYCDAGRRMKFGMMQRLSGIQHQVSGATLATGEWLPNRGGRYSTAIQMVDPARLSNPNGLMDTNRLRKGVETDALGAPIGYHFREALQSDLRFAGACSYKWKRVSRETKWGRRKVIHIYDMERAGQSHGVAVLASIIRSAYKLDKFQDTALESAILNAMFAATIETDFNYAQAADLMGADDMSKVAGGVMDAINDFYSEQKGIQLGGVKIPHLYAGEKLNFSPSNHPGPNFEEFEKSFNRHLGIGIGLTLPQFTGDYSDVNYSSGRMGLQEAWKGFLVDRENIEGEFSTQVFLLWFEEAIDKGAVELPPGAPSFYDAKAAYGNCRWIGPARGAIDNLKEAKGDELEMDMGVLTMEEACARRGTDWEENLVQIAREKQRIEELGLARGDIRGYMASEAQPTD